MTDVSTQSTLSIFCLAVSSFNALDNADTADDDNIKAEAELDNVLEQDVVQPEAETTSSVPLSSVLTFLMNLSNMSL